MMVRTRLYLRTVLLMTSLVLAGWAVKMLAPQASASNPLAEAGNDSVQPDCLAGGNQQDPGTQVAIQQRVTGNILLTFSTNVTSTQSQTVQVQYHPGHTMSVSILRDQNGG
jgi:hypothetical protein